MKCYETNKFPALCKFFDNQIEFANAGCMSVPQLSKCLSGKSEFTYPQQRAICNEILVTWGNAGKLTQRDKELLLDARTQGRFNEVFRIETV